MRHAGGEAEQAAGWMCLEGRERSWLEASVWEMSHTDGAASPKLMKSLREWTQRVRSRALSHGASRPQWEGHRRGGSEGRAGAEQRVLALSDQEGAAGVKWGRTLRAEGTTHTEAQRLHKRGMGGREEGAECPPPTPGHTGAGPADVQPGCG